MSSLDPVRAFILAESKKAGKGRLAEWSKRIGRNATYLQQYIKKGSPAKIDEEDRRKLAMAMKVPESKLIAPGRHIVRPGEEFEPDPEDRPETEGDKPFPDAVAQMEGRIGGGSTGAVITIEIGDMQTREPVGDWWRIPPSVLRGLARADSAHTVGFAMDGDSMEPTIQRTDIVFVDTGRQNIEPDGIWALDYGLGRTMKRVAVRKTEGGIRYVLKSDNKSYPDEEYAPEEVTIFGRYIGRFSVF